MRNLRCAVGLAAMVASSAGAALAAGGGTLFGTDGSAGNLITVDVGTGAGAVVGALGFSAPALAVDPTTGIMYAGGGGGGASIYTVDSSNGTATLVGSTGLGTAAVADLAFRADGTLYAAVNIVGDGGTGADNLATIDKATGAATVIGPFGDCSSPPCTIEGIEGIAFDSAGVLWGSLRVRNPQGMPGLYTIDPATGTATFVRPITLSGGAPPAGGIVSLEFACDGTLYGGTSPSVSPGGDGGTFGTIDPASGVFTPVGVATTGGKALAALAFALSPCGPAVCDRPYNPFVNCGFETGDFTGWTTADIASPFLPLAVFGPRESPGLGLFSSAPTEQVHAAITGFDGGGPGAVHVAQDVTLPPGARQLTFDYRAGWDLMTFCGGCTGTRHFQVSIQPPGGGAPLGVLDVVDAAPGTINLDTGPLSGMLDVSAFAGSDVRISFDWIVPESFTGPAHAQLDDVAVIGCGDGIVQAGEQCDDGNVAPGDGCGATCAVEQCFTCTGEPSVCVATTGPACEDGNPCTTGDHCAAGVCLSGGPTVCPACEVCRPADGCVVGRRTGCRASLVPKKTQLLLIDKSPDKKDRLAWKWRNGAATAFTDFGDPRTSGDYALCVYDASSGPASLLMRATAPAGGRCGTKPCWKARKGKSFVYADPGRTPDGLFGVQLKSGADGKAAITVGGSGDALPLPTLPLGLPITVQVQAGQGPCWEATYTTAGTKKNTSTTFNGRASAGP